METSETSKTKVILKTAAITMAILLVATVAIAVLVAFAFPFEGYKMADSLGMKKSALYFAERYAAAGNIDGLVYCVELDEELLAKTGEGKYALNVIAHTEDFFEYDNAIAYFRQLDEYYIKNSPRASHVGLYSYEEYLISRNFAARALVGEDDVMLFRGVATPLDQLFASAPDNLEKAMIYSAVGRALDGEKTEFTPLVDSESFTEFYYALTDSVTSFIVALEDQGDKLTTLFMMRSIIYLTERVNAFFERIELASPEEWTTFTRFEYDGMPLVEAYSSLFASYVKGPSDNTI